MATIMSRRVLFILPLLFASSFAQQLYVSSNPFAVFNKKHVLGPHELFGNPYGNPNDYKSKHIPDDYGTLPLTKFDQVEVQAKQVDAIPVAATNSDGSWELVSLNSGVSAMHTILLPKTNKVLMYDATIWKISKLELPPGHCRVINQATNEQDCFAHSVLYDIDTAELKPLELHTDTWCSSGGLTIDGNFVSTGGFQGGANTVRYLETCQNCNWREYPTALAEPRWYSTQATLPDGGFIVVGGRNAFSYEYIPAEGQNNAKAFFFDLLKQTNDKDENNLYPFVYLSTDGNVFIFANNRAVLLNPKSNNIVKEFPQLPGGHRNYPASALSALLPIMLNSKGRAVITAEVLICGGSAHIDSYTKAGNNIFYTALQDCGRLRITDENPVWKRDLMPSPRVMGDAVLLPTGEVLMLNGAKRGCSGWGFARDPNFKPVIYNPRGQKGQRFKELAPSDIARMYHSTSTLLPDGKVLVSGSNTNNGYIYDAMFPTELRVEKFSPPYLDFSGGKQRPTIMAAPDRIGYGDKFKLQVGGGPVGEQVTKKQMLVTVYAPAFTTHGVSMNQRLISLVKAEVSYDNGQYQITAVAPPSGKVAPPGYYMLFVVFKGIPSVAHWVQIV
ncbi:glyoxal oxidase 1 [Turnera subulata]|uniref:Glyoxal oxidase 1 n=1 Tax=Turnera subulata TaxID=218843 RepID=A0A9Q0FY99_9ROSI|nr:glyoxal oxidase 1 [Turnera subulata]